MFGFLKNLFGPKTDFKALVDAGALIIDVRTPEEFRAGHVEKSVNIPLHVIGSKMSDLKKKKKVIIAICRSGRRSGTAAWMMKNAGIEAYNGGGWRAFNAKLK